MRQLKRLYFLRIGAVVLWCAFLTGCHTGYLCPINTDLGACQSQTSAYYASLHTDGHDTSVFEKGCPLCRE
jgi:hypothetical protein